MKKTVKKSISIWLHTLAALVIIGFSFFASYVFFIWSGYPPGGDAAQHLSRLTYIFTFPSSFNWFHVWSGGMPQFLWYPSFSYIFLSFIMRLAGLPAGLVLTIAAVASIGLTAIGIYFLIFSVTRSKSAAFLSAILFLSTPAAYTLTRASVYTRQMALPFLVFAFAFFVRFWRTYVRENFSKIDYVFTVLFLGLVLINHLAMGVTAVGFIVLVGLFTTRNLKRFLAGFIKVILPALFLSSAFWLPLLFYPIPGFLTGKDVLSLPQVVEPWSNLFYFFNSSFIYFFEPNPFILPFFLLGNLFVWGLIAFLRRKRLAIDRFEKRLVTTFFFLTVLTIFYAKVTFPIIASFYSNIWPPLWVLLFSAIFLSLLIGLLFALAVSSMLLRIVIVVFLVAVSLAWMHTQFPLENIPKNPVFKALSYQFPFDSPYRRIEANRDREFYNFVSRAVVLNTHQFNFRFGTGNFGHMARWFNVQDPFVPQTREYFYVAVVNPDSYFHLIQTVWNTPENYPETNFLLDWWGVKQFIVGDEDQEEEVPGKFANKPESYRLIDSFNYKGPLPFYHRYDAYEFQDAGPILTATQAPTVLVVGKKNTSYNTVFRALSYANIGSRMIIPIQGSEFVDDYNLSELKKFSVIFLYDYRWHNFEKADRLLTQYVQSGGHLVIEENKDTSFDKVFEVAPVASISREEREGDWLFDSQEGSLVDFDQPLFNQGPWAVVVANRLKEGANVLLKSSLKSILVSRDYGQGKVIWSGMNLPFHIIYYQNQAESEYLSFLLGVEGAGRQAHEGVSEDLTYTTPDYQVTFVSPQERRLMVTGDMEGVLFKEFYFPNWHAYLVSDKKQLLGSKKKLEVYKAGPGFMYVSLLKGFSEPIEIVFRYEKSFVERLSFFISVFSLIALCLYSFEGKLFPSFVSRFLKTILTQALRITNKVGSWWDREEE